MRLINAGTGQFEEFIGRNAPKYAILSHTWEDDEVTFKDMSDPSCRGKKGYRKIAMSCQLALQHRLSYVWVDTCCIDKSSSAELTEAINSMFQWYERSEICFAFLADLAGPSPLHITMPRCRWFTRGWTLQELVAPSNILFYDCEWSSVGSKRDLVDILSRIAAIPQAILLHERPLSAISVAQKMSWAANRQTTRSEDIAYCLLGIFNVNMPLLYGEEEKAFRRLQEEIMKTTADFSIFAWRWPAETKSRLRPGARIFCGFLAASPNDFSESSSLAKLGGHGRRDFSFSNSTIKTQEQMIFWRGADGPTTTRYVLPLDCTWDPDVRLGILLRVCGPDQFIRDEPWTFVEYTDDMRHSRPRTRYLLTELPEMATQNPLADGLLTDMTPVIAQRRMHALQIEYPMQMKPLDGWPMHRWDEEDLAYFVTGPENSAWDSATQRFNSPFGLRIGHLKVDIEVDFVIWMVGWSSLEADKFHCGIVDYNSYTNPLKEAKAQIMSWDSTTTDVRRQLAWNKIPQTTSAVFNVPGQNAIPGYQGQDLAVVVTLKPTLVNNPWICRNDFWRVHITCKLHETWALPQIEDGGWGVQRRR